MASEETGSAAPAAHRGKAKNWNETVDTALHVLKGAAVAVLGTPVTAAIAFQSKTAGKLTLKYACKDAPDEAQLRRIEELANEKIKENPDIVVEQLERDAAEKKYRAAPVNGTFIYDLREPPASVTTLTLTIIPGWNVNSCQGPHVPCAALKALVITGTNLRAAKEELDLKFLVGDKAVEELAKRTPAGAAAAVAGKSAPSAAAAGGASVDYARVDEVTDAVLAHVLDTLCSVLEGDARAAVQAQRPRAAAAAAPIVQAHLTALKNASYAAGFVAPL